MKNTFFSAACFLIALAGRIPVLSGADALAGGSCGAGRTVTSLSGGGWTCDGESVTVPHTWNAVDGCDGIGPKTGDSASSRSYLRKAARYRRGLPDPEPGRRAFIRFEGVSIKATVFVNGHEAGRHAGAFTAFCFEVTPFLRPTGNVLEVVADNRYDPDVPPVQGDFTMYGGIYRDVTMIQTEQICIDPVTDGASGVAVFADPDTGEVTAKISVLGAPDETRKFKVPDFRLWSPETPVVYTQRFEIASGDAVTETFGFRKIEWREGRFYLNGKKRQMRGVNYHQDRQGKGWAVSKADIASDIAMIRRELGADAVRTAHNPHSDYTYDLCDELGLLAWVEAPVVNRIRFTPAFTENARTLVREMVAQLRNHPSVFTWSTSNEVNFKGQSSADTVPFMKALAAEAKKADPTRAVASATFRDYQTAENAVPDIIGFNYYPGWYRSHPDGMRETVSATLASNTFLKALAVSEYGAGASVLHQGDVFSRGILTRDRNDDRTWHPESYQAWVHYRNYRQLVEDDRVWGTFVWLMYDFGSDVVNEGAPYGLNNKGLVAYDHETLKDSYWFYRANWRADVPLLHLVGTRMTTLTNETVSVLGFSTVGETTLKLNGKVVGTQRPDSVKAVFWRGLALEPGTNRVELTAGGLSASAVWVRVRPYHRPRVASDIRINYDQNKVGSYVLEPIDRFLDGRAVDKAGWPERRREILDIFSREMYGREPPPPESVVVEPRGERAIAGGKGTLRGYDMYFRKDRGGPKIEWSVMLPAEGKGPYPVIVMLNYKGVDDLLTVQSPDRCFPVETILGRGYAVVTAAYRKISPDIAVSYGDPESDAYTGIFELWGERDESRTDNTSSFGAWAWAVSRGLDLAERLPETDARRSVTTGFSRLAKAALLAAARDERFAVCVPVQTGAGGSPLAKRDFGETVASVTRSFPHWFCKAYRKYRDDPAKSLTFDQHMLLATIAPRRLLVLGFDDPWYDPLGEFLAAEAAGRAWELNGLSGLPQVRYPSTLNTSAIGENLGYARRPGAHGIGLHDWKLILDFADKAFGK